MKVEKIEEIGIMINKILGENREDFWKCYLAKNLAKDRFGNIK
jgi:hypothetical protein